MVLFSSRPFDLFSSQVRTKFVLDPIKVNDMRTFWTGLRCAVNLHVAPCILPRTQFRPVALCSVYLTFFSFSANNIKKSPKKVFVIDSQLSILYVYRQVRVECVYRRALVLYISGLDRCTIRDWCSRGHLCLSLPVWRS